MPKQSKTDLNEKAREVIRVARKTTAQTARLQAEHGELLEELKRRDAAMENAMEESPSGWERAVARKQSAR